MRAVLALMAFFGLAACSGPAVVEFPLALPGSVEIDSRLPGAWVSTEAPNEPRERGFVAARLAVEEPGFLAIEAYMSFVSLKDDANPDSQRLSTVFLAARAWPTVLGGTVFHNIELRQVAALEKKNNGTPALVQSDGRGLGLPDKGYYIARLDAPGDGRLTVRLLSEKAFEDRKIEARTRQCGPDCTGEYFSVLPEALAKIAVEALANEKHWVKFDFVRM